MLDLTERFTPQKIHEKPKAQDLKIFSLVTKSENEMKLQYSYITYRILMTFLL